MLAKAVDLPTSNLHVLAPSRASATKGSSYSPAICPQTLPAETVHCSPVTFHSIATHENSACSSFPRLERLRSMSPSMQRHLHKATPTLSVIDSRALRIRSVAYHRSHPLQTPETRITLQVYDSGGRPEASWDPRLLGAQSEPNLAITSSLSAKPLLTQSVDAGWRLKLLGTAGELLCGWDGRHSRREIGYDELLRAVAVSEQAANEPSCVTDRMTYADSNIGFSRQNQCGQLIRHDDTAGCLRVDEFGLSGARLRESRRFMNDLLTPDWPIVESERDKKLETETFTTQWNFSAVGDLRIQTDAKGHQQVLKYNSAGQIKQVQLKRKSLLTQTLFSNVIYNAAGQIARETAGNGVETVRHYEDGSDRLLRLLSSRPGHIFQDYVYDYDPVGNITSTQDSAQPTRYFINQRIEPTKTFIYDSLYQLIEATGRESVPASQGPALPELQTPAIDPQRMSAYKQTFAYDPAGNLQTIVHQGRNGYTRTIATAPISNRSLLKTDDGEPDFYKDFDSNGNLLALAIGAQSMQWNTRNQLIKITQVIREDSQNDAEHYIYDSNGQRLRKVINTKSKSRTLSSETRYLPNLEVHYNSQGEDYQVICIDSRNCKVRVPHWDSKPPQQISSKQGRYGFGDHLGSSTLELDEDAGLLSQEGYYAFGGTAWWASRNETEAKYKTIRYSGKERDSTGLYYYGFRYYAPWLSRWISPDPAGSIDGLNLYKFVRNNPVTLIDNMGLESTDNSSSSQRAKSNWQRLSAKLPNDYSPVKIRTVASGIIHVHIQATEAGLQEIGINIPRQTFGRTLDYLSIDSTYQSKLAGTQGLTKLKAMSADEIYDASDISGKKNIAYINGAFFNKESTANPDAPQHATIGASSISGSPSPSLPIPEKYSDLYTKVSFADGSFFHSAPLLSQGGAQLFTSELSSQSRHKFDPANNIPGFLGHAGDANARSAISMPVGTTTTSRSRLILGSTISPPVPNDPGYTMEEWSIVTNRLDKLNDDPSRSINLDGGASTVLGAISDTSEFLMNVKTNRDANRGLANFIVFYK